MAKIKVTKKTTAKSAVHSKRLKPGPNTPVLSIKNVTKKFGSVVALDGITFDLMPGERIGLIGGNGAGKTTLSETIAGLIKQTSGTIQYGFKYQSSPQEKIGMQFQQSEYPSGLSIKDMIMFAINLRKLKISKKELESLLKTFQIEEFYKRKAKSVSGGQRQKLNILMSIIHNPEIIILDELSTGLDIAAREDIISFVDTVLTKNKIATILISHHMGEIEALCDKVIVLDAGKVQNIIKIKAIKAKYGSLDKFAKSIIKDGLASRKAEMERTAELGIVNKKVKGKKQVKEITNPSTKNEKQKGGK